MEICKKKFLFNAGSQFISISIFSSQYEKVLTVVIMGLDLVCSQFLSTLFCYEKKTVPGIATIFHKFLEGMEYPFVPVWNMLYNYPWYC